MNDDLKNELSIIPDYDRQIITKSAAERIAAMKGLLQLYIASDMTAEIYQKMYLSSVMAIEKKKDMAAKRQAYENFKCSRSQSYVGILGGNNCYSIIGNSGIGKTSAIERSIELINRNTEEINGAKILNVLVVQTPFDCSVKGLMLEIIRLRIYQMESEVRQQVHRGEIWRVEVPTGVGRETTGFRWSIVISNQKHATGSDAVNVVYITGKNVESKYSQMNISSSDLEDGTLEKLPSRVNITDLYTVDKKRLVEYKGRVNEAYMKKLMKRIALQLGIKLGKGFFIEGTDKE